MGRVGIGALMGVGLAGVARARPVGLRRVLRAEGRALTLVEGAGTDDPSVLVHELTHALQDQHFDLTAIDAGVHSRDEALALHAVIEGDATNCQWRSRSASRRGHARRRASSGRPASAQADIRAIALAAFDPAAIALDQPTKRVPMPAFLTR